MWTAAAPGPDADFPHNLPTELATFIGRESDLSRIQSLFAQARLVTLTGAGGCGKSRLALRVARDLGRRFPDGVWLVEFAPLTDSTHVPRAVAAVLGVRGIGGRPVLATLASVLAHRRLLLVLDNCEHLIGACARLAETLLRACPRISILATSRESLRVSGETTWRVPSLKVPGVGFSASLEALAEVEAVTLFLDRALDRRPDFTLTAETAPAVASICRHLDGLPLAIELAAAQIGALDPEHIAARLDNSLRLLGRGSRTLPRQATLRATLDWSHALLSGVERTLFRRLAVFGGDFGVEAAETVCAGNGIERDSVVILLTSLVEKSLVEPQSRRGASRFRLLEPVRQYAWVHLTTEVEVDSLRLRHVTYFLELAEAAEPKLMSGARGPWIERLATEQDNLRLALDWSRNHAEGSESEVGLRLAGALCWFWNLRGEVSEGLDWVETALARGQEAAPAVRAKALYAAGELACLSGRNALARARAEESVALFRALGDKRRLAYTLQSLPMTIDQPKADESTAESLRLFEEVGDAWGAALAMTSVDFFALTRDGDPTGRKEARLEEALARWRKLGDDWGTSQVLNILGDLARSHGDQAGARIRYEEALALLRRQGLTGSVPSLLHNLGYLALRAGDHRQAASLFGESLTLFRDQGDQRGISECLAGMAGSLRNPERAARLFGAAEAQFEAAGATVYPGNADDYARSLDVVRGRLDLPAFAAAWAAGRALTQDQAITEALETAPDDHPRGTKNHFELTPREHEVAVLIARGLTNRQIGATLFVTEGTARIHVKHILRKLGFTSRAQVAGWAVAHGLVTAPEAT